MALYIRKKLLSKHDAIEIMTNAEAMFKGNEYSVDSISVIDKLDTSSLSAYDLEFVILAESLNAKLLTFDKAVLKEFPTIAQAVK